MAVSGNQIGVIPLRLGDGWHHLPTGDGTVFFEVSKMLEEIAEGGALFAKVQVLLMEERRERICVEDLSEAPLSDDPESNISKALKEHAGWNIYRI